jgi:hypothetical protein
VSLDEGNGPVGLVDIDAGVTITNLFCQQNSLTKTAAIAAPPEGQSRWRAADIERLCPNPQRSGYPLVHKCRGLLHGRGRIRNIL